MGIKLRGGRVLDPASEFDETADVYVHGGVIAGIGKPPRGFKVKREIDVSGLVVAPGLVDLGSRLREPGFEHKATVASEARAAARGGITTLCAMPDTHPIMDTPAVVEQIYHCAQAARGARVLCVGALTVDLAGEVLSEMHALKAAGCVAVTNLERTIKDTAVLKHALAYAASADLTVFLYSEEYWLGRQGFMHEGATSTRLGVPGIPRAAEIIGLHRDLTLIEETGVRAHLCRLTTAEALTALTAAKRAKLPVTADTSILNLHYIDEDIDAFDANLHVRPPLRAAHDRKALRDGLKRRTLDAVCAYHEPHDADAKAAPFAQTETGASTLDTVLSDLLALAQIGAFDLKTAFLAGSLAPHRILGAAGGTLAPGAPADLIAFDPAATWTVCAETLASQGKNNPRDGDIVRGRNYLTLVAGNVVFEDLKGRR